MSLWKWLTRRRADHGWPGYIINGRIRTSTASLTVAFLVTAWLHNAYHPTPPAPAAPETQVVPPGFLPDPAYTWVPRTYVQPSTTTTPTTTTESSPTTTSSTTNPSVSGLPAPSGQTSTTVIDPNGTGTLPPQTITGTPTASQTAVTPTTPASSPRPPPIPVAPPR